MRVLLVEDSIRLSAALIEALNDAGFTVDHAPNIETFRTYFGHTEYELFVIDLGLPDGDGFELVKVIRAAGNNSPVFVVTARGHVTDRVHALDKGADDYLVKPFHHDEFMARIKALLRRSSGSVTYRAKLKAGNLSFDIGAVDVYCGAEQLALRPSEGRLLRLMASRLGSAVTREAMEASAARDNGDKSFNAVEKCVSRLRKNLSMHPTGVRIRTVWGIGYALEIASADST